MSGLDPLVLDIQDSRRRFLDLVADIRPDLHRYCARMTGSISDGEDIVQETLARAYFILPELEAMPPLRPWLFRIAQTRAIDHLRRYEHRMSESFDETVHDSVLDTQGDPTDTIERDEALHTAIAQFLFLAPLQRSCVVLKDVLGHSLDEIAALLDQSIPSIKAALHRGRSRLKELSRSRPTLKPESPGRYEPSPQVARYAQLFNARDWVGIREMLADDVRLDLVSRSQRHGRSDVGGYVSNYEKFQDWRFVPASLDGHEVIAVFRGPQGDAAAYFIELAFHDGRVASIRDYRYVSYIASEAHFEWQRSA